ncbi:uncharacterized protein E5676_scaffold562G00430 [Cucumis melo var. makuwa]|uniref:Uncharacterized protein n=1 Tax=Cucumis melo var. makuwa TaxID=1194695 RepID=A0A5D3BIU0_CUCMM|nr:uncharacterized protein E5676_scaffold562G00430 [Cucumis melo var. makuwa]
MLNQEGGSRKENCQEVTLRSRRNLTIRKPDPERKNPTFTSTVEIANLINNFIPSNFSFTNDAISLNPLLPPPFPDRLKKKGDNQEFYNFLDIPKQLHINISFADALEHMPFHVKLLKHILVKKRRINDCETMALTQATSDISKNGMPEKITDPSSFTVSCSIGGMNLGRALCDIAASINLMPFSIFKKL